MEINDTDRSWVELENALLRKKPQRKLKEEFLFNIKQTKHELFLLIDQKWLIFGWHCGQRYHFHSWKIFNLMKTNTSMIKDKQWKRRWQTENTLISIRLWQAAFKISALPAWAQSNNCFRKCFARQVDYAALIVDDEKEIKRFSRAGFVVVSRLECQTDIAVKGERIHYQGRIVAFGRRRGN